MIKCKAIVMSDWDLRSTSRLQDKIQSTQSARWRTNEIKDPTDWSVSSNEVGHLTVHHVVFLAFMMDHLTMAPSHFERILDHTSCDFIYHRKYMKRNIWVDSLYSNYVLFSLYEIQEMESTSSSHVPHILVGIIFRRKQEQ